MNPSFIHSSIYPFVIKGTALVMVTTVSVMVSCVLSPPFPPDSTGIKPCDQHLLSPPLSSALPLLSLQQAAPRHQNKSQELEGLAINPDKISSRSSSLGMLIAAPS